jgi:hypothetical protein
MQEQPEQEELEIELEKIEENLENTPKVLNPKEVDSKEIKKDENK